MSADADDWTPPSEVEEFRLLKPLGRGAMGQVFLAYDTLLERKVAVKFIAGKEPDPALREQFFVEARAIARLSHPNVVAIHRVGEVRRRPYLVSELVHGRSLAELPKPVDGARLVDIGLGLSRGLAAAHRRGVLHCDLKPANAMITDDGEVKLLDFGLARLLDRKTVQPLDGQAVGSPLYMAPELWRGEPATCASDVYSIGVFLYELATGSAPDAAVAAGELARVRQERDATPLFALKPALGAALCAVVDRCLCRDPARRWESGESLREALEALLVSTRATLPEGNPYRGLLSFDAAHQGLFFGRENEARAIVDRLRSEPLVVVAGDSGVGKSSLCRAGVLPRLEGRALTMVPGRQPLAALVAALATFAGGDERELAAALRDDPTTLARQLRRQAPVVVFVDQLEELATVALPDEAAIVAAALASLTASVPGVRLLASARSDFLTRLASLPSLGHALARSLYLLPALSAEGVRDATVGPAAAKGYRFESPAMVDALVAVADEAGGLPLLQFALAALWEARDTQSCVIPQAALERMGGPAGALARHADDVLAAMLPAERAAAQRSLLQLVTAEGTRARKSRDDLVRGDAVARAGLEALVRGRLVVASENTYEIAHEALVARWDTLRGWLSKDAERRASWQRLERAAGEWERLGRAREALWSKKQLAEAVAAGEPAPETREAAFLAASRRAVRRRRVAQWTAAAVLPALALGIYAISSVQQRRDVRRRIAGHAAVAEAAIARARVATDAFDRLRRDAFARFDAMDGPTGEARWAEALAAARQAAEEERNASDAFETALRLDAGRADVRARFADVLAERARLAELTYQHEQRDEILARLALNDEDGSRRARWNALGEIDLEAPAGVPVQLYRYRDDHGLRTLVPQPAVTPPHLSLAPGSYLIVAGEVRLPLLVQRGEHRRVVLALPPPGSVPDGFVYIPPGRFVYGSSGSDALRREFFTAPPLHAVDTGAYIIARDETTYADWITFLEALPAAERARHLAAGSDFRGVGVALTHEGGVWRLMMRPRAAVYHAAWGEPVRYRERAQRQAQDWRRMPVSGVSLHDAEDYARWLSSTGRVPRARLCTEMEWERAARGADDREFTHGDRLEPDDANYDATYGQKLDAFGPDEIGQHPISRSPFGIDDLAGNIFEWTHSSRVRGEATIRGGCYYYSREMTRVYYRESMNADDRTQMIGIRVCGDLPRDGR
jgi:eukaryotic-like serine/threonine-protein kinase